MIDKRIAYGLQLDEYDNLIEEHASTGTVDAAWVDMDFDRMSAVIADAFGTESKCSLCVEEPATRPGGTYCRTCHDLICGFGLNESGGCEYFGH